MLAQSTRSDQLARRIRGAMVIALTVTAAAGFQPAAAQLEPGVRVQRVRTTPIKLSGPRVGVTWFQGAAADSLDARLGIGPVISQFGWQFENRLFEVEGGASGVSEVLLLAGGLDRGQVLPSLTWLMGVRSYNGLEIGVGPNVSAAGLALVVGTGANFSSGGINYPVNFAIASSKYGVRATMLVGFNTKNQGL